MTTVTSNTIVTRRNEAIVREAFQRWAAGASLSPTLLARELHWTIPGSGPAAGAYRSLEDFVERGVAPLGQPPRAAARSAPGK